MKEKSLRVFFPHLGKNAMANFNILTDHHYPVVNRVLMGVVSSMMTPPLFTELESTQNGLMRKKL